MATVVKVTTKGREAIANRLKATSPTQVECLNVAWGQGGVGTGSPYTATLNDVALFQEASEARVAGTSTFVTTTSTNDTYQVVGTITAAGAKTIAEAGLYDSTTKPAAAAVAAGGVVGSAVATTLNTAATFTPGNNNFIQIDTEVMQVTAGSGSTALTVVRGQNGTTAIATIAVADVVQPGNPPGQSGVTGGTQMVHATFTGLALNLNDSIQFTFQVQISSA
jgi:hypothetical protein